ncbi:MAG TPA: DUF411 domain-containing protein [Gemmatimonadaceae bacterium]|nr:DUF411 domain-containing protein [Gemmatimonadaceae bacterium]
MTIAPIRAGRWTVGLLVALPALAASCSSPRSSTVPDTPQTTAVASPPSAAPGSDSATLVVYKESTCPCCNAWVDYMRTNGFRVVTYNVSDLPAVKTKHGIGSALQSCHTTEVGGYFVEGHVPAELVRRLLSERPRIAGLAVPGMPIGSPGMDVGPPEPYDIMAVDSAGRTSIFASRRN